MKQMIKNKWLLLVILLLPILSGCNDTDDVQRIFTGKTWKLSVIRFAGSDKECKDYWVNAQGEFNQKAFEKSNKLVGTGDNFTLTFSGTTTNDIISGKLNGRAVSVTINNVGWSANGENKDFKTGVTPSNDTDVLANAFLKALSTAESYDGDENNLYLYFSEGQQKKFLCFSVKKD